MGKKSKKVSLDALKQPFFMNPVHHLEEALLQQLLRESWDCMGGHPVTQSDEDLACL